MVSFGVYTLPPVQSWTRVKPRIFTETPLPSKEIADRQILGGIGLIVEVKGKIEGVSLENLGNKIEEFESYSDGITRTLSLGVGTSFGALMLDPVFEKNSPLLANYTVRFVQSEAIPFEIPTWLEGNYSTWAFMWNVNSLMGGTFSIQSIDEISDLIILFDGYTGGYVHIHTLSTGELQENVQTIIYGWEQDDAKSVLGTYFVSVFHNVETGHAELRIYKNCALIQTIDLFTVCGWTRIIVGSYVTSISHDGKYILVHNYTDKKYALFEGS